MKTKLESDSPLRAATGSALRAYRVMHPDMGGSAGIYAATSPGKARYMALKGAHEAGYRHVTMPSLVVRRAKPYDAIVRQMPAGYGWDEDYALQILEQNRVLCEPPENDEP